MNNSSFFTFLFLSTNLLAAGTLGAQSAHSSNQKADGFYEKKEFKKAEEFYQKAAKADPADADLNSITAEMGLMMAELRRPGSVLPLWSRMAIAEFAWQGASYDELATKFQCGKSTVWRCVKGRSGGFAPLSGQRLLTMQQQARMKGGAFRTGT